MSYKAGLAAMIPASRSTMSGEVFTSEDRAVITKAGHNVKTAGYLILAGLSLVAVAEIVGHRNMTFKGDSFFNSYKKGRGVV